MPDETTDRYLRAAEAFIAHPLLKAGAARDETVAYWAAQPSFQRAVDANRAADEAAGREAEPPAGGWPEWALRAIERAQTIGIADGREAAAQAIEAVADDCAPTARLNVRGTLHEAADVDALPPTQYLILEVLAARHRLGEVFWTFPKRFRPHLNALADAGLVNWEPASTPGNVRAHLTEAGRAAAISETFTPRIVQVARNAGYQAGYRDGWDAHVPPSVRAVHFDDQEQR